MLNTFDLVLFGGTGDLSTRKLIPALYRQETVLSLNNESQIIGVGTKNLTNDEYIKVIQNSLEKFFPGFNDKDDSWKRFSQRVKYNKLDINSDEDWKNFNKTESYFNTNNNNKNVFIIDLNLYNLCKERIDNIVQNNLKFIFQ